MTDEQHHDKFDWATELSDAQGHVTLSEQEAHEIGARLRSLGEKLKTYEDLGDAADDVQLLRMGYAAARLEIESLRAAQPAGAQQPSPTPQADSQPAPYEIINMAREQGLPETETEGVFRVNVDDLGRIFASYRAARAQADSVLEDATFEAVRKKLCALPRYSFVLDDDGLIRRVLDRTGNWIAFDDAHELFDPVAVDAVRKQGAKHDNT